jgi:hypothetical protein
MSQKSKYVRITIDGQEIDIEQTDDLPIAISYQVEDVKNFQEKRSASSLDITVPATTLNSKLSNGLHNPDVLDMTEDKRYSKPVPAVIEAGGYELLVGKAFRKRARHRRNPISYDFDLYGDNADWIISLRETTLFDALQHVNFLFTKEGIIDSWAFDGRDPQLPYVFAPFRHSQTMDEGYSNYVMDPPPKVLDWSMSPHYMRPSLSIYWILYWGFKLAGYKIESDFFETDYFRRAVTPWVYGSFLYSDGTRLDNLDFLAKADRAVVFEDDFAEQYIDCEVSNDSTNGAFDNNGSYVYDAVNLAMKWTYLPAYDYGNLDATFHFQAIVDTTVAANSRSELHIHWFKNGVQFRETELVNLNAPVIGRRDQAGTVEDFASIAVVPGDVITAKVQLYMFASSLGRANFSIQVVAFELDYFRIPLGGTIDFKNYNGLKKHKFLDLLRGVTDAFNLEFGTDSISKTVRIEPAHAYSLTGNLPDRTGYWNGQTVDWTYKQDLSKDSVIEYLDEGERELIFCFKEDNQDGLIKMVQDRYSLRLASSKYVLPERYQAGKKEYANRFFSPTMHYLVRQWEPAGEPPYMVAIVPENRSDTSGREADNTIQPKMCWYKGIQPYGWVFDQEKRTDFPMMFAVNYNLGGENDPVFSYCDEAIPNSTGGFNVGRGLLKRFFWQRLANMRRGMIYNTSLKLNNFDVCNQRHREYKLLGGHKWELIAINSYKPLMEQSTDCVLRYVEPLSIEDKEATFPSDTSVLADTLTSNSFDQKYKPLICLTTDIPA